ncbi:MAG: 50S ribosomal protein L23 [Patescibacteria group bacterium]
MALFGNKKTDATDKKVASKKVAPKKEETAVSMNELYKETATKTVKSSDGKTKKVVKKNDAYRILVKPLVTEKAAISSEHGKYVFVVSLKANKIEVAKAVEAIYGVKVVKVNIANVDGKKVSRGKIRGQRKDWRKATVTLEKGQTIKIYEGV